MKIALIQICSKLDPVENINKINQLIQAAKEQESNLEAVFLPEVFYSMSDGTKPTPFLVEGENDHYQAIRNIAKKNQIYLLGGSAATKVNEEIRNRSFNFSPEGELLAYYDKIHLFSINLKKERTVLDEAQIYSPGKNLKTIDLGGWKMGLTICFDLRFPELFREYFTQGVNVFSVSSAFTKVTGKAHWLTLLKARAIENQSYVIACGQWGEHNEKISTYGHSYVIDPWGEIVADVGEGENYAICDIDLEKINTIRSRMNMKKQIT